MKESCAPTLRLEIAAAAARLIADGGLDYASAKRKAALELVGRPAPRGALPDNDEVDDALREHLTLFDEAHADRVRAMRALALELMSELAAFEPLVTGAAWKGLAAEHAALHLQLFPENGKEVDYWLLNRHIDFEVETISHFNGTGEVPVLGFLAGEIPVMLSIYEPNDRRGALREGSRGAQRGDREALRRRLEVEG